MLGLSLPITETYLRMNTFLEIFLRSVYAHKIPISSGTKSIKHVRLSRDEYYQRATITEVRQTGTGILKFITLRLWRAVFDKPTRRTRRHCVIIGARMSRYNGNEKEKARGKKRSRSGFHLRFTPRRFSAETRGKVRYITRDSRC